MTEKHPCAPEILAMEEARAGKKLFWLFATSAECCDTFIASAKRWCQQEKPVIGDP
jgi:hypothetical protein